MIDSMFLGIFAGVLSCLTALLINYKLTLGQDVDIVDTEDDSSNALAKTSMYLLATLLICLGAAFDATIGGLAISVYTLFGLFAFVVADECVNNPLFGRLATQAD